MDNRRKLLIRNKRIATGLMIGAAILFVVARMQKGNPVWEWIAAFAEAAMVGALADWFAVVALFRHPAGLPIPHTAIIKNKKEAIADNLAKFIREKFLANDTLAAKLQAYNPAEHLATYLISGDNAAGISKGLSRILADSLDFMDNDHLQQFLRAALANRIEGFDLSTSAGNILDRLRKDNRHQVLLDEMLSRFAGWLATEDAQSRLAGSIDELCTKEYPILSVFIPNREQFTKGAGEKVARRLNDFVQTVNEDPEHQLRQTFDNAVTDFIARLHSDTELRIRVESFKLELLNNHILSDYAKNMANDLKNWLENDLKQDDSKVSNKIAGAVNGIGMTLSVSMELKKLLNEYLERLLLRHGDTIREIVARHISGTVKTWETDDYSNEIELSIGSDLQFIRMNGTLVGGLIGILLHALSLFI